MDASRCGHRFCVQCGDKIPRERLAILPDAVLCVRCVTVKPRTADDIEIDGADLAEVIQAVQNDGENR